MLNTPVASPEDVRAAGFQFLGRLAAEVSSGTVDLPCFPDVVLRIRNALADPKNTPEKTVTVVSAEPQLGRPPAANRELCGLQSIGQTPYRPTHRDHPAGPSNGPERRDVLRGAAHEERSIAAIHRQAL